MRRNGDGGRERRWRGRLNALLAGLGFWAVDIGVVGIGSRIETGVGKRRRRVKRRELWPGRRIWSEYM